MVFISNYELIPIQKSCDSAQYILLISCIAGNPYPLAHVKLMCCLDKYLSWKFCIRLYTPDIVYLQNFYAPDPDPEMEVIEYDRTPEQNDYLGISDMKTENYQNDAQS